MPVPAVLVLCAAAGLNPWVTLLMVAGLAAFTPHVPMQPAWAPLATPYSVAALAALLGANLVAAKIRRTEAAVGWVDVGASVAAGVALALGLGTAPERSAAAMLAIGGAMVALLLRLAERWLAGALAAPLRPYGRIAAGMLSNLVAAVTVATVFAVAR